MAAWIRMNGDIDLRKRGREEEGRKKEV